MSAFMWSPEVLAFAGKVRENLRSRRAAPDDLTEIEASIGAVLGQPGEPPIDQAFRDAVRDCVLDLHKVGRFWRPEG